MSNSKEEQDSVRCLYVGQRESATVRFDDPYIDIIGSDDATTCHIALIVDDCIEKVFSFLTLIHTLVLTIDELYKLQVIVVCAILTTWKWQKVLKR